MQQALATAWETLNPAEPGPRYLATFMTIATGLIIAALIVRQV